MTESVNRSLLPQFIKSYWILPLIFILPQIILLFINVSSYWLISKEVSIEGVQIAYTILGFEICLLLLALTAWWFSKSRKSVINWGWNIIFLVTHIVYLWYVSTNLWQIIPTQIEPWILNQGSIYLYQFTFIMPGLFYGLLCISCFKLNLNSRSDLGVSLLIAVLAPTVYYLFFICIVGLSITIESRISEFIAALFFIFFTVIAFVGMIRFIVLSYNSIRNKRDLAQIIFVGSISILGPIAGLILNKIIPFPADFQSPWVYILAIINGLIVLIPSVKKVDKHKYLLFARSMTYPFTLYFFLVFLPFLPISLPATFFFGLGFLILTPVVLFLVHTKKIYDDFKICKQADGMIMTVFIIIIGLIMLPGYFTFGALRDKVSLKKVLQYVYSPDYNHDLRFQGSLKSVKRTLLSLKEFKEGIHMPYLSGFYNKIVFEGMVLPDKKIDYLYKLFAGEEIPEIKRKERWGFRRMSRSWQGGTRASARDRNVKITSINVRNDYVEDIVISRVKLKMRNAGNSNTAELFREIHLPQGVLITDFQLKVKEKMVQGQIFEKKAAMWVYHMIRDYTRIDPGILTYRTPTQVNLNIYPFASAQERVAEIEFKFPKYFSPTIEIGEQSVELMQTEINQNANTLMITTKNQEKSFIIIPEEELSSLPKTIRKPYLHFIIDFSKDRRVDITKLINRISSIAKRYNVVKGMISVANFEIEDLTFELVDLTQRNILKDILGQASLQYQGTLDLGRIIKHHLLKYQNSSSSFNNQLWKHYPIFVVMTKDMNSILELEDTEFFKRFLPDNDKYLVANSQGMLEERALWKSNNNTEKSEVIILKAGNRLSIIPVCVKEMQISEFDTNLLNKEISVYDSERDKFIPLNDVKGLSESDEYKKGLELVFDNYEILVNPAKFDKELSSIVKRSREISVMIPSTSYIIVERSSQWKILKVKEKERLRKAKGLEFEEDFDTPAPSIWLLLICFFVWYYFNNKAIFREEKIKRLESCRVNGLRRSS